MVRGRYNARIETGHCWLDTEEGAINQQMWVASGSWNQQGIGFPRASRKESRPTDTEFSLVRPTWASLPTELEIIRVHSFNKATQLVAEIEKPAQF